MKIKGYYDLLLTISDEINSNYLIKNLEAETIADLNHYLVKQFNNLLLQQLTNINNVNDKISFLNQLLATFSTHQLTNQILLQVNDDQQPEPYAAPIRLVDNHLFTNDHEQALVEQFYQELITSDAVFLIYPFISKAMLNKLYKAFHEASNKQIMIHIITTTFDNQALYLDLYELEQLIKQYSNIMIRIEDNTQKRSERIHIKAAIFHRNSGFSSAIIGSSNFTNAGMVTGREWNIKINEFNNQNLYANIYQQFMNLWNDHLLLFNDPLVRNDLLQRLQNASQPTHHLTFINYYLYDFQIAILNKLQYRRKIYKTKHLIIMATGTGKTVVSAFDYYNQIKNHHGQKPTILFLAHQREIIEQALQTFRHVLKDHSFANILNYQTNNFHDHYLFATIQTVHRHLKRFDPQQFDLIIFDEAHHMAAKTFAAVVNYFQPREMIGLTATPEREDNKSILPYFDNEFAHELRLWDAINQRLLAKFDYYCIDDLNSNLVGIDLNNDQQLFKQLNTKARNNLLLDVIKKYIGIYHQPLALIFCINMQHAEIIADFLMQQGLQAAALTSKVPHFRSKIIYNFRKRKINYLCVVNMFNEGIDVPEVDTIILLRPTNSKTIYLQQLGRGLRKTINKNKLVVYDLIANIDQKYDITVGIKNLYHNQALLNPKSIRTGFSLPAGCSITLEPRSKEIILNNLQKWYQVPHRLTQTVQEYYEQYQTAGLGQLLADYNLNLLLFYNYLNDFYCRVGQNIKQYAPNENNTRRNKNLLKQFLFLNDYQIVNYFYLRLSQDANLKVNYAYDNLLICSLFYEVTSMTVFRQYFSETDDDLVKKFITEHQLIVTEVLLILQYKLANESLLIKNHVAAFPLLQTGSTFTVRQALCAIKRVNFIKQAGPLKIIAFQAGYLTYDNNKSVVFADIDGQNYGKKTNYLPQTKTFSWSIPETKTINSKLVSDLQDPNITKLLFLNNPINHLYQNLTLKLYNFIGIGQYLITDSEQYITLKFKIK